MNVWMGLLPNVTGAVLAGWAVYVSAWDPMIAVCAAFAAGLTVGLSTRYSVTVSTEAPPPRSSTL